jgi:hypothetical protein
LSGTTITYTLSTRQWGYAQTIGGNSANTGFPSGVTVVGTQVLFQDSFNNLVQWDGTNIAYIQMPYSTFKWVVALDSSNFVVAFRDQNSNLNVVLGTVNAINAGPIGFSSAGASSGNQCTIVTDGQITGFSGLTSGVSYYHNGDGTITSFNTGRWAGVALNSTTLYSPGPIGGYIPNQ